MGQHALFVDLACVINCDPGEVFHLEQVRFADGTFSLCRKASKIGYRLVMVTHQKDTACGTVCAGDYNTLMRWMRHEFLREEIVFDGMYHCPSQSTPEAVESDPDPWEGRPGAGTLRRAARDLHLALSESVMVASQSTDVAAANAGGLRQAFVLCGAERVNSCGACTAVRSLGEVEAWLVAHGKGALLPAADQSLVSA
jgi:D-glycero-D-manno-heptose 1,7-bisphosphate phosphatase